MAAPDPAPGSRPLLGVGLLVVTLALALADAARRSWLCDDAFISFRYARNLQRGHGLVFNVGEAVEGYTNFLWTVALGLGMELGARPEALAPTLGLAAFAGTLGVLGWAGWRSAREAGATAAWVPLAALCFAGVLHARVFATSGLETSAFTLLYTLGGVLLVEARGRPQWMAVGLVAALATLTRPEGALLVVGATTVAALSGPGRGRAVAAVLGTAGALLGPWLAWKLSFYGDLLPNTWYAKASSGPRWEQGLRHVGLYLRTWPLVGAGLLAAAGLALRQGARLPLAAGWTRPRAALVLLGLTAPYLLHVVRVGGDFMFARFCLPLTPLLLLAVEQVVQRVPRPSGRALLALLLAATTALAPRPPELDPVTGAAWHGIVEETAWYPPAWVDEARRQGAVLRDKTAGVPLRVVYYGTQAMLMYYAELPVAVEGHVGLTDAEIARMEPDPDARIGHGQKTSLAYLRKRGIDLAFDFRLQQPHNRLTRVDFGEGVTARLLRWRPEVVRPLQARGVRIADLPAFLDGYIAGMAELSDEQVQRDLRIFRGLYFDHNADPDRLAPFEARAAAWGAVD